MRDKPDWEKVFTKHISDKYCISKIYKELLKLNNKKKTTKKWAKDLNKQPKKKDIQMANRRTERCSTQFTMGEPQIKTMRHNYVATGSSQTKPLTRPNADGNALLRELSIAGEMQNGTGPLEDSVSSSVEQWTQTYQPATERRDT